MKHVSICALLAGCSAALALSGCNGGSYEELAKAPISFQRDTGYSRAQVSACVTTALSRFGSDLGRFPDIDPGVTRLILGGADSGHYRNYFEIDIMDQDVGSHVSVRRSNTPEGSLSASQLNDVVQRCTGS